jgi:hypothetical protein
MKRTMKFKVQLSARSGLKKWNRAWKIALIEAANPNWDDLYETLAVQDLTIDSTLSMSFPRKRGNPEQPKVRWPLDSRFRRNDN